MPVPMSMGDRPATEPATFCVRNLAQPSEQHDLSTWATELAATLPPLTESQAATVGRIATRLDARIDPEQAA